MKVLAIMLLALVACTGAMALPAASTPAAAAAAAAAAVKTVKAQTPVLRLENRRPLKRKPQAAPRKAPRITEQAIAEQKRRIERLQEGILEHKTKVVNSRGKEEALRRELAEIEGRLLEQRGKLAELHQRRERTKEQYDDKQVQMHRATEERDAYRRHVQERLAAFYRMGSIGLINVAFSAERLPDLLTFQEYFQHLVELDRSAIRAFQETITRLAAAREELDREQLDLAAVIEEVEVEEERLASTLKAREELLEQVNTEHDLYLQAISQIEKGAADLAASLLELQKEARRRPTVAAPASPGKTAEAKPAVPAKKQEGFLARRGHLAPPVAGILVSSYNGDEAKEIGGIDIKAEAGAAVRAVADGTVVLAAFLGEHGNMLILDHGDQYYTILSRLGELQASEGTRVAAGQEIAVMAAAGDHGDSLLHFEVRHGATSEDPLQWLAPTPLASPTPAADAKSE